MKKIRIQIIGMVLLGSLAFVSCNSSGSRSAKDKHEHELQQNDAKEYTCSMHPEVVTDKQGDCPKCGMALVEKSEMNHEQMEQMEAKKYTCTMHPEVILDKPGDCPKCGMKLVEKEEEDNHTDHEHNHE